MGGTRKQRSLRKDRLFEIAAATIQPDARRFDQQLEAVEWAIATKAEACHSIPETNLWMIKTDLFPGAPRVRVYFTIDDENYCTLRWVEVVEGPATDDDFDEV